MLYINLIQASHWVCWIRTFLPFKSNEIKSIHVCFPCFAPPFAAFNSSIIDPMEFILIQVLQVHIAKYCLIRFQFSVREMRYSNSTLTFFQKLLTFVLVNLTNHKPDSLLAPCPFHSSAACPAILALTPLF